MHTTRRELLGTLAFGAGAVALPGFFPRVLLGQTTDGDLTSRIRADLQQHAAFGDKFSGGPGDTATAQWIAGRLRKSGFRVEESDFQAPYFVRRAARITTGSTSIDVLPQAPVVPTGPAGVNAPLALVEGDAVGDVRDRIALFVLPFGRHAALFPDRGIGQTVMRIARAGARAVVLVTTGPSGEAVALNSPEEPFVPIPAAIVAPRLAAALVDAAKSRATATLVLDGDATHRPCRNLVARVERGNRWIAISTPRSGWFGCVGERGTGTAAFLELTDWAVRRFPDMSVFAMNSGGHEYFFAGSHRAVEQAPPPSATLVWAHVGATLAARDAQEIDGRLVMLDTADPQRSLMATDAARDAAAKAFAGLSGLTTPTRVQPGAGELSAFTDRGYTTAFAVIGVHRWFHTSEDTIDRVDARLVTPVVTAHQRAIELLVASARG
jgi:hypothetical protein